MKFAKSLILAAAVATLAAGSVAVAEDHHMSPADMETAKKCKAMSHDDMMKDHACTELLKHHPDAMKDDEHHEKKH